LLILTLATGFANGVYDIIFDATFLSCRFM
jgi:hypothetical protein